MYPFDAYVNKISKRTSTKRVVMEMSSSVFNTVSRLAKEYKIECMYSNAISFIKDSPINFKEFSAKLPWELLTLEDKINQDFAEYFKKHLSWYQISSIARLSEEFILKYSNELNWSMLSQHQNLSEEFMEANSDRLDWSKIPIGQTLSENFILKHMKELPTHSLFLYQRLSPKFKYNYFGK